MSMSPDPTHDIGAYVNHGQRQWVTMALLGGDITAQDAAARLSLLQHADEYGVECPDVRTPAIDYDALRDRLDEARGAR
jgi:hypothetical protein